MDEMVTNVVQMCVSVITLWIGLPCIPVDYTATIFLPVSGETHTDWWGAVCQLWFVQGVQDHNNPE